MTERGYAVAAVNYRRAPEWKFPAPLNDVKCAVRFLRANAATYKLDPNRFGIWGGSAGGQLAAFVGLTDARAGFDVGEYPEQSSAVLAVADLFGPTDLTADLSLLQKLLLFRAFETIDSQAPLLKRASPINYISKGAPPFLILQGEQDDAVPLAQSQAFYEQLTAAGVDATLVVVKNANHNFAPSGGPISPSRAELSKIMGDFFDRWVGSAR
jgi:acetyl esterase/lipase